MSKIKLLRFVICGFIFALGFVPAAHATPTTVSFTSTSFDPYSIGHDSFKLYGMSGSVSLDSMTPTFHIPINSAEFPVGSCPFPFRTCTGNGTIPSGFFLTLGSGPGSDGHFLHQPVNWTETFSVDTAIADPTAPVLFVLNGIGSWYVSLDPYTLQSAGGTVGMRVTADFTPVPGSFPSATPEPTSVMLFGTGLLSIVLLLRKNLLA